MIRRLKIGFAGPMTGPRAAYGTLIRRAVADAEPWFDAVWGNDMASVRQAESVAQQFIKEGVDAVVGHFNSDCARAAGVMYQMADIPFLMPASTASDLTKTTAAIRVCANDAMQVEALAKWLDERGESIAEIWEDGSAYASRLSYAIRERGLAAPNANREAPVALLGAHYAVAHAMQDRRFFCGPVFVPDDCAISDFASRLNGVEATVICAHPEPDFARCMQLSLALLRDASERSSQIAETLNQHPSLAERQHIDAGFTLQVNEYGPVGRTEEAS